MSRYSDRCPKCYARDVSIVWQAYLDTSNWHCLICGKDWGYDPPFTPGNTAYSVRQKAKHGKYWGHDRFQAELAGKRYQNRRQ